MHATTTVEVKCECRIPFHFELVNHLERLFTNFHSTNFNLHEVPQLKEIITALQRKMIFIKVTNQMNEVRPILLKALKKMLNKDLVGTIKGEKNEITFILI